MPSENATLERIQKEISEEIQREKELRRLHLEKFHHNNNTDNESNSGSVNGDVKSLNGDSKSVNSDGRSVNDDTGSVNGDTRSVNGDIRSVNGDRSRNGKIEDFGPGPMIRAQSTSSLLNGDSHLKTNGFYLNGNTKYTNGTSKNAAPVRLFAPNPQTKGVMQRFIKSRGKLNAVNALTNGISNVNSDNNGNIINRKSWVLPEFIEPTKVTIDPSKCVRRGFVPVEERMRKEFKEMHVREIELKKERRKSQTDYLSLCEDDEESRSLGPPIRAARSMAQLYNPEDYSDTGESSAPNSLKPARSLAELCDVDDETELLTPTCLISKFETIIRKNQQART